jgi:hypothetical protein
MESSGNGSFQQPQPSTNQNGKHDLFSFWLRRKNEKGMLLRFENEPFSLEFWMVPWRDEGSTVMFAFCVQENPGQFVVRQEGLDVLMSHTTRPRDEKNRHLLVAGPVIAPGKRTLVTVTAGPKETTLYVNRQAQSISQSFGLSRRILQVNL